MVPITGGVACANVSWTPSVPAAPSWPLPALIELFAIVRPPAFLARKPTDVVFSVVPSGAMKSKPSMRVG
jgi:hypothetical protein